MAMSIPEYPSLDGTALAELVRSRALSPAELLAAAWDRVEQLNPQLNAVCWQDRELGEAAAAQVDPNAAFAGVPFLLKDGGASATGLRLTFGSRSARDYRPAQDGELTRRYRRAGLVIFGRTTSPEYGINVTCEGPLYAGPTRNPWSLAHSAGGSSSGAAAAVAAGIVPMAHGSDGGGSLRIPASCCGLFTLKVTRARLPHGPGYGESWSGMATSHVITRSVRDCARALDATHGPDVGAPYVAPAPRMSFAAALNQAPMPLRIGFTLKSPDGRPIHQDCVGAVLLAAKACESLGHIVTPAKDLDLDLDFELLARTMRELVCANTACEVDGMADMLRVPASPAQFEEATWTAAEIGRAMSASDYLNALHRMHRLGRRIAACVEAFDLMLTPTLAEPPTLLGRFEMNRDYVAHRTATLAFAPFTPLANVSGQPAMSVPLAWNDEGLPIGVQFIGRYGDEVSLLQLATQLERVLPWSARRPPLAFDSCGTSSRLTSQP
ncbi:MAG: amidase [Ideonella sp.]|nr:amidase [Ideonella sp.]